MLVTNTILLRSNEIHPPIVDINKTSKPPLYMSIENMDYYYYIDSIPKLPHEDSRQIYNIVFKITSAIKEAS